MFYIIEYWHQFQRPTLLETLASMVNVSQGGLVVYGSLLAGGAALTAFVWRYRVPGLALSDLVAPSVVLGMAIGRIGCFFNGCCYGGASDLALVDLVSLGQPAARRPGRTGQLPIQGILFPAKVPIRPSSPAVEPDSPAARAGLAAGRAIDADQRIWGSIRCEDAELLLIDLGKYFWHLSGDRCIFCRA